MVGATRGSTCLAWPSLPHKNNDHHHRHRHRHPTDLPAPRTARGRRCPSRRRWPPPGPKTPAAASLVLSCCGVERTEQSAWEARGVRGSSWFIGERRRGATNRSIGLRAGGPIRPSRRIHSTCKHTTTRKHHLASCSLSLSACRRCMPPASSPAAGAPPPRRLLPAAPRSLESSWGRASLFGGAHRAFPVCAHAGPPSLPARSTPGIRHARA